MTSERQLIREELCGRANDEQVGGSHYRSPIQHWDYVLANNIPYMEAQVIRYVTRWRRKGGLEDLRKAQHFLRKLIEVNHDFVTEPSKAPQ
jgi:hypothetical protein